MADQMRHQMNQSAFNPFKSIEEKDEEQSQEVSSFQKQWKRNNLRFWRMITILYGKKGNDKSFSQRLLLNDQFVKLIKILNKNFQI